MLKKLYEKFSSVKRRLNSLKPSDAFIRHQNKSTFGFDNGLSPDRRQAIILTNAGLFLIKPLGTSFS